MQAPPPILQYLLAAILLGLAGYTLLRRHGPNPWIGVRLPWTFANREIWDKSWLLAALILVGLGLGLVASWTLFVISLIALIVLGISYPLFLYYRKNGTWRYWKDLGGMDCRPAAKCSRCGHIQKLQDREELKEAHLESCGASLTR